MRFIGHFVSSREEGGRAGGGRTAYGRWLLIAEIKAGSYGEQAKGR
jgi:hypothetical protein